jgi:hypothetical protein
MGLKEEYDNLVNVLEDLENYYEQTDPGCSKDVNKLKEYFNYYYSYEVSDYVIHLLTTRILC